MPALSPADIKARYARAMALLSDGKPDEALPVLGEIAEANPSIPEVQFQIGRIFLSADRYDRAHHHFALAAGLRPQEASIWHGWAAAVALHGDTAAEAEFLARLKAAALPPALKLALQDRFGARRAKSRPETGGAAPAALTAAAQAMATGKPAEAEARAMALLKAHPKSAAAANILASARAALGKAEAVATFREAARLDPAYAEPHLNLGQLLLERGEEEAARLAFREAVVRAPGMVPALVALAVQFTRSDQPEKALPLLERAVKADPRSMPALLAMGNARTRLHDYAAAAEALEKAARLPDGRTPAVLAMLAQAQARQGRDEEALRNYDAALAINPDHPVAQGGKAALLQTLGRFDEAEDWFRRAFRTDPANGENYRLFVASHKTQAGDPIIDQMTARFDDPATPETDRMNLGFAIAKVLEDVKDHARVFRYLDAANGLMRKAHPYDIAQREAEVQAVRTAMSGFDWQAARIEGATDFAPIFVTGMPRSGTTLVEQIIASHSTVEGAGEVGDGTRAAQALLMQGAGAGMFRRMADLSGDKIAGLGREYEAMMRRRFPDAPRVTDKSIQTYLFLGLTRLALPKSRIIVVRRDPRDTLLSIYKNKFPDGTHLYAYDQRDLAKYYTSFTRMIDFWRDLVPGWFHEVQYEDLVANPEAETRKLIAACGLDWEDACLNFHENRRKVETLSVFQVRQPISKGSVQAWRRYEAELAPMIEALKEDGHVLD
ncbi:tetratricopeptide repeat protein [Aliigemmobacter aestuarii]|uniref:Tetratricopeptide repeat protein n=1 Tax=Aliigemmobacter aestuarii TaxID=1445661 RepID=A0A4S3MMN6_9RHOB|nr:tetratricopeptide repeat-containing sulfotransferase family protein [Gemmobacter aestuarii]THD83700.1 tetratricopeptide repeat protein [Gemmobacter aestuarii]